MGSKGPSFRVSKLSAVARDPSSQLRGEPSHLPVEDNHFFIPCMDYFTEAEKEVMLKEELEFDKSLIREKYRNIVIASEKILTAKKL